MSLYNSAGITLLQGIDYNGREQIGHIDLPDTFLSLIRKTGEAGGRTCESWTGSLVHCPLHTGAPTPLGSISGLSSYCKKTRHVLTRKCRTEGEKGQVIVIIGLHSKLSALGVWACVNLTMDSNHAPETVKVKKKHLEIYKPCLKVSLKFLSPVLE